MVQLKRLLLGVNNEILRFKIKDINIFNVLASIAVFKELDLSFHKAIQEFKNLKPTEGRGRTYKIRRYKKVFKLIDESYNANPFSVKTAINNFSSIKKIDLKKYLLLGDMLELGKNTENYLRNYQDLLTVLILIKFC